MRAPRPIYTDIQENLGDAEETWFKWNFFALLAAIALSFGTYALQRAFGFYGMGINVVLFLLLTWFLNTWLTTPTLISGSWLAGLPFLRVFGFTPQYLSKVVPFILFWSCGIVLVNSVVPWFWWPFYSYLALTGIIVGMGIWAWNFKPDGKIVKDLSWKFLVYAVIWALIGLPVLSWVEPWFEPAPAVIDIETGKANQMYDPVANKRFEHLSPEECAKRRLGYCINPDTGTRLVPYIPDPQQRSASVWDPSTWPVPLHVVPRNGQVQTGMVWDIQPGQDNVNVADIRPVSSDAVSDGCREPGYDTALRCRTVQLAGRTSYQTSLSASDPKARCTYVFPPMNPREVAVEFNGPTTTVTNFTNGLKTVYVYEVYGGQVGPDNQRC